MVMSVDQVAKLLDRIADQARLASNYYDRQTALSVFMGLCEQNNLNAPLEGIERDILLVNQFQCR
jgi:hypothetical protein